MAFAQSLVHHPQRLWVGLACLLGPSVAMASDFTGLLYILEGVTAGVAIVCVVIAWVLSKQIKSELAIAAIWGTLIALLCTPMSSTGGSLFVEFFPAIFGLVYLGLGGFALEILVALKYLLVSIPGCIALVAFVRWLWRVTPLLDLDR